MDEQAPDAAAEVKRLQRCMNDLVSVLALPVVWSVSEPERILETLLDALMVILDLDLLYARVRHGRNESWIHPLRTSEICATTLEREQVAQVLRRWIEESSQLSPEELFRQLGWREGALLPIRMGMEGELGFILAGSQRPGFPKETESLVLNVAANQAAIELQQAMQLTEQKRAALELDRRVEERTKKLAETNETLELLVGVLQSLPVVAWTLKPDGTPDFVNQVWFEYSDQTLSFMRSRPEAWMSAVHPDDLAVAKAAFWQGVGSGQNFAMETRFQRRDGVYRWHLNQAVVLRDAEGKVVRFVGTSTDIDDWKRAQEQLRTMQAELARVMRMITIGQLTSSIAHEVSQPLSGVIMNASTSLRMLKSDPPNIDGARENVQRTVRDSNRALEVITRLRTLFSRKQIQMEPLDLNEAAREVISLLSSELQKYNVLLQHEIGDCSRVSGDRVQLQQVMINLLRNALEASIGIDDRPRQILLRTANTTEGVIVSVQDCGIGFSQETHNRLFEPFFTTKPDGMGIGLSLSRSIVEAHRGRLWAQKNDGPGVTFSFVIPFETGSKTATAAYGLAPTGTTDPIPKSNGGLSS